MRNLVRREEEYNMGFPAVAYYQKDNSGFLVTDEPFIIADFDCENDAIEKQEELITLGYKSVRLFEHPFDEDYKEDGITKEYIAKHLL